jgi:methyl-accepting chemotaxis protein
VQQAVERMGQVSEHLASGRQLVDKAGVALDSIIENSGKVLESVKQVTQSSEEQAETTLHIGQNIETISRVTHEAASGNQTIASAVQEMSALIEDLQTRVARFRLGDGAAESIVVEKAQDEMLIPLRREAVEV